MMIFIASPNSSNFKPFKAKIAPNSVPDESHMVQGKWDGVRIMKLDNIVYTRNFTILPNNFLQRTLSKLLHDGMEGELLVGGNFNNTQSVVMSKSDDSCNYTLILFDFVESFSTPYYIRYRTLKSRLEARENDNIQLTYSTKHDNIYVAKPFPFKKDKNASWYAEMACSHGLEGVIIRDLYASYGNGTFKYKLFLDGEATIIDYNILLSKYERKDTLGALVCDNGMSIFNVGSGFTEKLRDRLWNERDSLIGRTITYRYDNLTHKGKPRFPRFVAFRDEATMEK